MTTVTLILTSMVMGTYTHLPPAEGVRLGSLMAMGVSGGLLPCPEALGIMVIAIGLSRRWSRALPLVSAVIVTALGVGSTLSGLAVYLG